jgi:hypothetical protein
MDEYDKGRGESSALSLPGMGLPSEEAITCEGLHYLTTAGVQLLRNLEIVKHDLALMAAGKRLLFALDFSELFSFLWPEQSTRGGKQVVHALFSSDRLEFTLPPGAQIELIRHIRRLASENMAAQQKLEELTSRPFVAALMKAFEESQPDTELQVVSAAISAIHAGLPELGRLAKLLRRLVFLSEMKTLIPLYTLLNADDWELQPDSGVLHECVTSLNLLRPGERQINNFVDAHNYSLLWTLSNAHVNTRDTIYLLVTSSAVPYKVFRRIKWGHFPETLGDPSLPELSLVRHPTQVLYLDCAMRQGPQATSQVQSLIQSLARLLTTWRSLPEYEAYLSGKEKATTSVQLPKGKRYLNNYLRFRDGYQRLYSSVREAIETDLSNEENIRRLLGVSTWSMMDPVPGAPEGESQLVSTRIIFTLFDKMNTVMLRSLGRFEKGLVRIPSDLIADVDVEGVVYPKQRLTVEVAEQPEFKCREIAVVLLSDKQPYFSGDLYSDYYSLWWPTALTFQEFLTEARWFIAAARASKLVGSYMTTDKDKEFDGIYLYLQDQANPMHLTLASYPDLNPDDILSAAEKKMIIMVRIAMEIGDLFYEFLPMSGQSRRSGIISHVVAEEAIALLIYSTNLRRAGFPEVSRVIHEVFAPCMKEVGSNAPTPS